MSARATGPELVDGSQAGYLRAGPDPVLTFLHRPSSGQTNSTAVLIVPPFGWEEVCSYRGRRTWARSLADAGFATARLDLPGTGDSGGGARDPDRLGAWTRAVSTAASWLADTTGAERVAAVGIGLGGIVASLAVAEGARIDDLILWSVRARGRSALREMQAYAAVVAAPYSDEPEGPDSGSTGGLELTGFLMSEATVAALRTTDLTDLPIPEGAVRRVLLLERDGLGVDQRLLEHFRRSGASVDVAPTGEFDAFVAHPQEARAPLQTIAETIRWLGVGCAGSVAKSGPGRSVPAAVGSVEFDHGEARIRESCVTIDTDSGRRFAILSEPADGPLAPICGVFLDAGAIHRIGPNRNWVEVARSWAARGVATIRVDFGGIGDSEGDERVDLRDDALYAPSRIREARAVLDHMESRGLPGSFVLAGLCSGAHGALHVALEDTRVQGAAMINLYAFFFSEALVAERDRRKTYVVLRSGVVQRLLGRGISREALRRGIRGIASARHRINGARSIETTETPRVDGVLDRLRASNTHALLLLSAGEPLYDQFVREGRIASLERWPNLRIEQLPSRDHMYRAIWLQSRVRGILDSQLDRLLQTESAART